MDKRRTKIIVLAALGTSITRKVVLQDPATDDQWDRAKILVLKEVGEHKSSGRSSAELAAMESVLQNRRADEVEAKLVLFWNAGDEKQRRSLDLVKAALGEAPVAGHTVELVCVDIGVTGIEAHEVREAHEAVLRHGAGYVNPKDTNSTEVYVNATSGLRTVNLALHQLALTFSLPVVVLPDARREETPDLPVIMFTAPPLRLDPHHTLRMVDAAYLAEASGENGSRVAADLNVSALVVEKRDKPVGSVGRSVLADVLEQSIAHQRSAQIHPAGAALLRRHGHEQEGVVLKGLVRLWVEQRIWSLNRVPEMVLHDDRHAERVDHLVSMLAEPLLGSEKISKEEAFLLSCAAWLHDWGHVGYNSTQESIVHPIDVRRLHGPITEKFLTEKDYWPIHKLDPKDAQKVGLIAAHHQSWTHFPSRDGGGNREPADVIRSRPENADPCEQAEKYLPERVHTEFCSEDLADGAKRVGMELDKVKLLVAILRVADGADLGRHRIPGGAEALEANRRNYTRMILNVTMQVVAARVNDGSVDKTTLQELGKIKGGLFSPTGGDLVWAIDELHDLHATFSRGSGLQGGDASVVSQLIAYLCQVKNQPQYDEKHRYVLAVRFEVAKRDDGLWNYSARVTPASHHDREEAERAVDEDIRSELSGDVAWTLEAAGLYYSGIAGRSV